MFISRPNAVFIIRVSAAAGHNNKPLRIGGCNWREEDICGLGCKTHKTLVIHSWWTVLSTQRATCFATLWLFGWLNAVGLAYLSRQECVCLSFIALREADRRSEEKQLKQKKSIINFYRDGNSREGVKILGKDMKCDEFFRIVNFQFVTNTSFARKQFTAWCGPRGGRFRWQKLPIKPSCQLVNPFHKNEK